MNLSEAIKYDGAVYDLEWWEMVKMLPFMPGLNIIEREDGVLYTVYDCMQCSVHDLWKHKYRLATMPMS